MMAMKTIYKKFCIPFIKHLMINVRKMLQMNILISE